MTIIGTYRAGTHDKVCDRECLFNIVSGVFPKECVCVCVKQVVQQMQSFIDLVHIRTEEI